MNLYDFLIIYLTCGAPFAVYYFLQHRFVLNSKSLWLKTILNFLFWQPLAYRFLQNNRTLKNISGKFFIKNSDLNVEKDLHIIQKHLEKIIIKNGTKISVYELREIFARYVGLTIACQTETKARQTARYEIFQITGHNNSELAEICFERRNRKRLLHHQTQARRDFLKVFSELFESHPETEKPGKLLIKFSTLLNDSVGQNLLNELIEQKAQINEALSVKIARKDLWKLEPPKPSTTDTNPKRLKVLTNTATMNLRGKD
jgi:hypothetical protein